MTKKLLFALALLALVGCARSPEDVLEDVATAMGATNLQSIQYSGSGVSFALGQSVNPNDPWPRFNMTSYSREVAYEAVSSREEMVREGGFQPHLVQMVSGNSAWNVVGAEGSPLPTPAAATERRLQIWLTPHGFVKAARGASPTVVTETRDGREVTVVSFTAEGRFRVNGTINDQNLVENVETWFPNPVLGDMLIETRYSDYQDFDGVRFPTRIVQQQGGHPTLDLTVSDAQPNAAAALEVPDNARQASAEVRVESQRVAEGVWHLTGGSHHSVAVEFGEYVAVIEGPLGEERSEAVIAEVKRLVPNKPIRYLVNTHYHFDHSGGLRTYVAEGATIVTHEMNRSFYERAWQAPRTVSPDRLSQAPRPAAFETVTDKHVLTDGARTMEIHHIQGNAHNEAIIMAYLPRERLLIEADVYSPAPPGAPPPATPNPNTVNLYENIQRLNLNVGQIVPIHGRIVPLAELRRAVGR